MEFHPTSFQTKPISNQSRLIFEKNEHVLLGISPFNSFYSEQIIKSQIIWAEANFSEFNIFVPDTLPVYTFLALGYSEARAIKKTKRQAAYLKNKIYRALLSLNYPEDYSKTLLIDMEYLEKEPMYTELRTRCFDLYKNNDFFRNQCNACTSWVIGGHQIKDEENFNPHIAIQYILHEMPLFLDTPSILNKNSSVFTYHQTPELLKYLHSENSLIHSNQGYIELSLMQENMVSTNGELLGDGQK